MFVVQKQQYYDLRSDGMPLVSCNHFTNRTSESLSLGGFTRSAHAARYPRLLSSESEDCTSLSEALQKSFSDGVIAKQK